MSQTDDRRDHVLPITAEVGSEGGSYADPTLQVSTFSDDIRRTGGHGGVVSASNATRLEAEDGSADQGGSGMLRYPTEPPSPPSATEGWRVGVMNWRAAAMGVAAGAALAYGIRRLRTHRTRDDRGPGGFGSGVSDE